MHTKRIIPCLDVKDGRVVKGVNFVDLIDAGDPVECGKAYDKAGADELVFLDITASSDKRAIVTDMVRRVAETVFIPFTVGGGIRTIEDFRAILREGADKISVNSAAIDNPTLISEAAEKFGSQCVVLAIDARRRRVGKAANPSLSYSESIKINDEWTPKDGWTVYKNGGRVDMGIDAVEWAVKAVEMGIAEAVNVPVIASGGAGTCEHFKDAVVDGKADAALAASLFHFKELEIKEVKEYLRNEGISVRL